MKFKEKELEDWFCDNVQQALQWTGRHHPVPYTYKVIGRQVPCKGGILDVLVEVSGGEPDYRSILVVELKAKPGKRQDIEQVERYVEHVRSAYELAEFDYVDKSQLPSGILRAAWKNHDSHELISGIVIAPGGIADVHVEKKGDSFEFTYTRPKRPHASNEQLEQALLATAEHNMTVFTGHALGETIVSGIESVSKAVSNVN